MERRFVMFADFNKVFKKNQNKEVKIPDVILKQLNKKLDNGLKYIDGGNGFCMITADGKLNISGLEVIIDEKMKKYIGTNITHDSILEYSYNTQRPLHLKTKREGFVVLNGQEIPIERICFDPYKNIKYDRGEFIAIPEKFPEPIDVILSDGEYDLVNKMQRLPCEEKECVKWGIVNEEPIFIEATINKLAHTMRCDLKLQLKNIVSVYEIVRAMSIFYALGTGTGLMNGINIKLTDGNIDFKFDKVILDFWKKVLCIESKLNIVFSVDVEDIDITTTKDVEKLYEMLINKNPIKSTDVINSFTFSSEMTEMKGNHTIEELKEGKGTFVFNSIHEFTLFGKKIRLPSITIMTDVVVSDIIYTQSKFELIIDNSDTKAFYSELVFLSEQERELYNARDSITEFFMAKTVDEYMERQ